MTTGPPTGPPGQAGGPLSVLLPVLVVLLHGPLAVACLIIGVITTPYVVTAWEVSTVGGASLVTVVAVLAFASVVALPLGGVRGVLLRRRPDGGRRWLWWFTGPLLLPVLLLGTATALGS